MSHRFTVTCLHPSLRPQFRKIDIFILYQYLVTTVWYSFPSRQELYLCSAHKSSTQDHLGVPRCHERKQENRLLNVQQYMKYGIEWITCSVNDIHSSIHSCIRRRHYYSCRNDRQFFLYLLQKPHSGAASLQFNCMGPLDVRSPHTFTNHRDFEGPCPTPQVPYPFAFAWRLWNAAPPQNIHH